MPVHLRANDPHVVVLQHGAFGNHDYMNRGRTSLVNEGSSLLFFEFVTKRPDFLDEILAADFTTHAAMDMRNGTANWGGDVTVG